MKKALDFSDFPAAKSVFRFFGEISQIPRGSGNRKGIADYLASFALERGLEYIRDGADNVIIKKSATEGRCGRAGVVLQAHSDMVAQKTADFDIDMEREGLRLCREGDFLYADGTTLGADDGIGVAYMLALLDANDVPHPPIEALFTSDEEIGLIGAEALDGECITGRKMINIDSDREGVFIAGCAGGVRINCHLPIVREAYCAEAYRIRISGLIGGHSGADIDKGRVNASKLLSELLSGLDGIRLAYLSGGTADNAIPRVSEAVVFSKNAEILDTARAFGDAVKEKHRAAEPNLSVSAEAVECQLIPLDEKSTDTVISLLCALPDGIVKMSEDIDGLVETSLNLGILSLEEKELCFSTALRSSKESEKAKLRERVVSLIEACGGAFGESGDYPGWEYRPVSPLRDVMCRVWHDSFGTEAKVMAIHAGLECGILSSKLSGLDCVSIGPDCYDIHTTEERLSISSAARTWEFIKNVLMEI